MAAVSALLFTAACGGGNGGDTGSGTQDNPKVDGTGQTITVWVDETRVEPVKAAASKFEKDTGAKVKIQQKNFDDIRADFLAQVPTGKGPDLTVGAHDWLGEFTKNGVVSPIELGDSAETFTPVALEAFTYEGQIYGVPYAVENLGLFRNTDLVDSTPETFDEMIAQGKEAGTKYPFLIQVGAKGDPYTMVPFQHSFGAPVFKENEDGTYAKELGMGGPEGEAFAQWLGEQGKKGTGVLNTSIEFDIAKEAFKKGETPYMVGGPWLTDEFKDMNIAVEPIPSAGGEPAVPFLGVQGFYLNAQSENAILATNFLTEYIGDAETQVAMYEAGGRVPAVQEAADQVSEDPIVKGFAEIAKDSKPMPSIPEMGAVWNFWGVTEAQIIDGAVEPAAGWKKMVSDITKAIGG